MPLFTPRHDAWMLDAACAGAAPLFDHDGDAADRARAVRLCTRTCPVLEQCRAWAETVAYTGIAAGEVYRSGKVAVVAT